MFKRKELAHLPTKIESLPRLTQLLGGPELLIKRDDQTGLVMGGNKTRKLEYLIGEALDQGADLVLTAGAAQSNHCRQTAGAAARSGLDCSLILVGPEPERATANLLLDHLLGASLIWTEKQLRDQVLEETFQHAVSQGRKPYLIPYGGSNAIGAYAYLEAFREIQGQYKDQPPDWIVLASSSGGTQAGLWTGSIKAGNRPRILGISVDEPAERLKGHISRIAAELSGSLDLGLDLDPEQIEVNDSYTADGYGIMSEKDREAIHLFARYEGILLDPVYTGRAAGGLIDLIRKDFFDQDQSVLFWHTGGSPALFADRYLSELY